MRHWICCFMVCFLNHIVSAGLRAEPSIPLYSCIWIIWCIGNTTSIAFTCLTKKQFKKPISSPFSNTVSTVLTLQMSFTCSICGGREVSFIFYFMFKTWMPKEHKNLHPLGTMDGRSWSTYCIICIDKIYFPFLFPFLIHNLRFILGATFFILVASFIFTFL